MLNQYRTLSFLFQKYKLPPPDMAFGLQPAWWLDRIGSSRAWPLGGNRKWTAATIGSVWGEGGYRGVAH